MERTFLGPGGATENKQDAEIVVLDEIRDAVNADTFTKDSILANLTGENLVFACPLGQKIRLYFFGYSAGSNISGVLASLQWEGNSPFDNQYLIAPGQPYARNIKAGNGYVDGPVNADLELFLTDAQDVYVNYELEVLDA